jgi:hypothetical protein
MDSQQLAHVGVIIDDKNLGSHSFSEDSSLP